MGVLTLLFLIVPFAELFVLLKVGGAIGVLNTIVVLLAVSALGAWLVKREGLTVLRRAQQRVEAGEMPGRELIDGVLILFAGALLLTPGFLTDVLGVVLLFPPTRAAFRAYAVSMLARRAHTTVFRLR